MRNHSTREIAFAQLARTQETGLASRMDMGFACIAFLWLLAKKQIINSNNKN